MLTCIGLVLIMVGNNLLGLLCCCSIVWTWVINLCDENGPAMQLLVLSLSFMIPLILLLPVAITTTGMEECRCSDWYILALGMLGSTRLSSMRLVLPWLNLLTVRWLLVVSLILQFLPCSTKVKVLENDLLLLMMSIWAMVWYSLS